MPVIATHAQGEVHKRGTPPAPHVSFPVITLAPHSNYETGGNVSADSTCDIPEVNLPVNPKQYATISSTAACGIS
jgi:hypothetical protein